MGRFCPEFRCALAILIIFLLACADALAATTVGSIGGRVKNAVTGQYLNKARVAVKNMALVTFTNEDGTYLLIGVPAGTVSIEVFYTGLDPQEIRLEVGNGASIEQNVDLTSLARYGKDAALRLDPFVVGAEKENDGQALALNEQRFAPNIKNVIATDTFGDILGSTAGEFLKFLPGFTAESSPTGIDSVSLRGLGADKTGYTTDGAPMITAVAGGDRTFYVAFMTLSSTSRIEVTRCRLPPIPPIRWPVRLIW